MGKASITNLLPDGRDRALRRRLGNEIRRRRLAAHLSQDEVSAPMTRGYVSQVERGRAMPSLPALIVIAEHLGTSADVVLKAVNQTLSEEYPVAHEDD
jgi:transcriptional regulator with XRE-family HTH domain